MRQNFELLWCSIFSKDALDWQLAWVETTRILAMRNGVRSVSQRIKTAASRNVRWHFRDLERCLFPCALHVLKKKETHLPPK